MSEQLTQEQFRDNLNTAFTVNPGSEAAVELKLTACNDLGSTERQEQFSLLFAGPRDRRLEQRIYPMSHDRMGKFDLFIVPVKGDNEHLYYEAVFNRFRELAV